jgi:hypothetical protein
MTDVLFICKKSDTYGFKSYTKKSSGLWNSTRFIAHALNDHGVSSNLVEVVDNNCIDRVVTEYKPKFVIIEALWVVPEKFDVLKKLHPNVKWFVHMHSGIPFLALEGIAMRWLQQYDYKGITIIANSLETYDALKVMIEPQHLVCLPNVYIGKPVSALLTCGPYLNIACFGAIRPMKNHLIQAMAAMRFAEELGMNCQFHINGTRVETGGYPVQKNLIELFRGRKHDLVMNPWREPEAFIEFMSMSIDLGMQVSLTETFNVVAADYVTAGIPIVISEQIQWASDRCKADVNSIDDIVRIMHRVYKNRWLVRWNQQLLHRASRAAQKQWLKYFKGQL